MTRRRKSAPRFTGTRVPAISSTCPRWAILLCRLESDTFARRAGGVSPLLPTGGLPPPARRSVTRGPLMSTPLSRLVARVRRRLFLQTFGSRLVILGSATLLLLALGILITSGGRLRSSPWSLDNPLFLT